MDPRHFSRTLDILPSTLDPRPKPKLTWNYKDIDWLSKNARDSAKTPAVMLIILDGKLSNPVAVLVSSFSSSFRTLLDLQLLKEEVVHVCWASLGRSALAENLFI